MENFTIRHNSVITNSALIEKFWPDFALPILKFWWLRILLALTATIQRKVALKLALNFNGAVTRGHVELVIFWGSPLENDLAQLVAKRWLNSRPRCWNLHCPNGCLQDCPWFCSRRPLHEKIQNHESWIMSDRGQLNHLDQLPDQATTKLITLNFELWPTSWRQVYDSGFWILTRKV